MSRLHSRTASVLTGGDYHRGVVAVVAIIALAVAVVLRKEVLAAGQGTAKMQEIAKAVQEGAAAYLNRQFRTLGVFAVIVFALLFALPADSVGERIGRSCSSSSARCSPRPSATSACGCPPARTCASPLPRTPRRPREGHADRRSAPAVWSA